MQIIHYGHACVLVETESARLLIDPGTFSSGFEELTGLDAVLVTHQHPDHLDTDRLPALLAANSGAELVVDTGSADELHGAVPDSDGRDFEAAFVRFLRERGH